MQIVFEYFKVGTTVLRDTTVYADDNSVLERFNTYIVDENGQRLPREAATQAEFDAYQSNIQTQKEALRVTGQNLAIANQALKVQALTKLGLTPEEIAVL